MTVLVLWMGAILLAAAFESMEIEVWCIGAALDEIETRRGRGVAVVAAMRMAEGREWWEV